MCLCFNFKIGNKVFDPENDSNFSLLKNCDRKIVGWLEDEGVNLLLDSLIVWRVGSGLLIRFKLIY